MTKNIALSRLFSVILIVFSIFSLINAQIDFSYDYSVYIYYIDSISQLDILYVFRNIFAYFPLPYVTVPPAAVFEGGFVIITLVLTSIGFPSFIVYAAISSLSITIRAYVIDKASIGIITNIILTLSYVTLLEANAIRVGLSSSILLLSLLCIYKKRLLMSVLLFFTALFVHIQSFIYVISFIIGFTICVISIDSKQRRAFLSVLGIISVGLLIPYVGTSSGTKIDDYLLRQSASTGFNILSVSGLLICLYSIYFILRQDVKTVRSFNSIIWFSSFFAFAQATIFLIIGGAYADIGIRVWQFAFLFFVISTAIFAKMQDMSVAEQIILYRLRILILACCLFQTINVIIRYPLSNFFYPLIPYVNIEYINFW